MLSATLATQERSLRRRIRLSLTDWAILALSPHNQTPAAHHRLIIAELERVAAGDTDRLLILLPPGSAKSTYASLLFPAWWFSRHPSSSILATAHTGSLARHFGRGVRALVTDHAARLGYDISRDSRAAHRFATTRGGQYFAAGVRAPITGRRADLILIDDPVRSQADADSRAGRDHLWAWFRSDLLTRLRPHGRIVVVMTRWHVDDLAGRLLSSSDHWRVIRLPALAEGDDPLGRLIGAPLWPEWEDREALDRKRAIVGERAFAGLFQQNPRPRGGGLFHVGRIAISDVIPADAVTVRGWDLAATSAGDSADPDWTVGVKLARTPEGGFIVLDVIRLRAGPASVEETIRITARLDGPAVRIGLPQDPGQAGRAQILYLTRSLAGFRVTSSPETGAKQTRAMPVASQVDAGNLSLLRATWNRDFLDELADFPHGIKDDQVDALSRAFQMLIDTAAPARRVQLPLLAR